MPSPLLVLGGLERLIETATLPELAPKRARDHLMVINLSGRGDKDIPQVADILRGSNK